MQYSKLLSTVDLVNEELLIWLPLIKEYRRKLGISKLPSSLNLSEKKAAAKMVLRSYPCTSKNRTKFPAEQKDLSIPSKPSTFMLHRRKRTSQKEKKTKCSAQPI